MVFHWSLGGINFPQVSRTLLSILAVACSSLDGIGSSSDFQPFFVKPLGIVPRAPVTVGITDTFLFHKFLSSSVWHKFSSLFFIF